MYSFFGATPDSWIGKLWPRGRAWQNNLSHATLADNFCNRWSGGLNFLRHRYNGSEVSVEPDGDVYPCCVKTDAAAGQPARGRPDRDPRLAGRRAGLRGDHDGPPRAHGPGARLERGRRSSRTRARRGPTARPYQNLCIGCDRFHEQVLGPVLAAARERRRAARGELPPRRRRTRTWTIVAGERMTPRDVRTMAAALAAAAGARTRRAAGARADSGLDRHRRQGARPDASTGTPGPATRRPTPSSPGSARKSRAATASRSITCKLKDTAEAVTRVVAEKAGRPRPRRHRRPRSGSTARTSSR